MAALSVEDRAPSLRVEVDNSREQLRDPAILVRVQWRVLLRGQCSCEPRLGESPVLADGPLGDLEQIGELQLS